jgi:hypothetical protein
VTATKTALASAQDKAGEKKAVAALTEKSDADEVLIREAFEKVPLQGKAPKWWTHMLLRNTRFDNWRKS